MGLLLAVLVEKKENSFLLSYFLKKIDLKGIHMNCINEILQVSTIANVALIYIKQIFDLFMLKKASHLGLYGYYDLFETNFCGLKEKQLLLKLYFLKIRNRA